ncbi:MAG: hypothetical protein VB062_04790 [Christensenella sp.]|nr:hypothetical protein [Christensenella sp.]
MKCPKCGSETDSAFCRNCGTKMEPEEQKPKKPVYKKWWFWAIVAVLAIGLFGNNTQKGGKSVQAPEPTPSPTAVITPSPSPTPTEAPTPTPIPVEELKAMCGSIVYKDTLRDPSAHFGEYVTIKAKVEQVMDAGWGNGFVTGYRCYAGRDEYYVEDYRPEESTKIIKGDTITVYGQNYGTVKIKRALTGTKDEVVCVAMLYCDIQQ